MKREPVLSLGVLVAVIIAVLQEVGSGNISSLEDFILIGLPVVGAAIARERVTPVR